MFTNILEVKNKTAYRRVGDAKSKRKAIKFVNAPWAVMPHGRHIYSKAYEMAKSKMCAYSQ